MTPCASTPDTPRHSGQAAPPCAHQPGSSAPTARSGHGLHVQRRPVGRSSSANNTRHAHRQAVGRSAQTASPRPRASGRHRPVVTAPASRAAFLSERQHLIAARRAANHGADSVDRRPAATTPSSAIDHRPSTASMSATRCATPGPGQVWPPGRVGAVWHGRCRGLPTTTPWFVLGDLSPENGLVTAAVPASDIYTTHCIRSGALPDGPSPCPCRDHYTTRAAGRPVSVWSRCTTRYQSTATTRCGPRGA